MLQPADAQQPSWVCRNCGGQWARWWNAGRYLGPPSHCSIFQKGVCDVCNNVTGVTHPQNYGYLKEGWHKPLVD